ncbi:MAG TPA: glycosyltransferase [Smithella sp.]|nr:glycosyltransferase [Smithella sp.]
MDGVSIIIPALNERLNLEQLIPRIASTCDAGNIEWEALIVDSDSTDGTDSYLEKLSGRLPVRRLNEAVRGDLARAWRRGIEASRYSRIITMDADLCHTPEFIPRLLDALETADLVIASRYLHHRRRQWIKSAPHEIASRLGQRFCRWALRLPPKDISHGYRAFRKQLYDQFKNDIKAAGNTFMIALIYYADRGGFRIREIPFTYGKRLYGKDHLKISREGIRFLAFTLSVWRKS